MITTKDLTELYLFSRKNGLGTAKVLALMIVRDNPGIAMSGLAKKMGCHSANITGVVDALEKDGLVDRSAILQDRRKICLSADNSRADKVMAELQKIPF